MPLHNVLHVSSLFGTQNLQLLLVGLIFNIWLFQVFEGQQEDSVELPDFDVILCDSVVVVLKFVLLAVDLVFEERVDREVFFEKHED